MNKKKILLVDDEVGFTTILGLNLESEGYEVRIENNSLLAKSAALDFQPHLILLDIVMPDEEGPDVFVEIKNDKFLKDIPIVFLTASVTREETMEQENSIGGRQFISKPADLDKLLNIIEKNIMASTLNL